MVTDQSNGPGIRDGVQELLSFHAASVALASSPDLESVLEAVTSQMRKVLSVEGCAVFHFNAPNSISLLAANSPRLRQTAAGKGELLRLSDYPLRRRVLAERASQQINRITLERDDPETAYMEKGHIQGLLMLPMVVRDRVTGLLELRSHSRERVFTDREIAVARMLSTHAAHAIENARLLARAQLEIENRTRSEEELAASLRQKDALLQETHHRVKNNLQIICSLLNLQSRQVGDPAILQMFKESQDRVRSMALVHEKLYRSRDMVRVDFGDYLRSLTHQLVKSYRATASRVNLYVTAEHVPLTTDKVVPCALIANELITNALQHAFPGRTDGEIHVTLRQGPKRELTLSVADNGVGLPTSVHPGASETLGLQLIRALTSQLGGTAEMTSSRDSGTEIKIAFAVS
ncbi:MAG: histidine kinase dimerization/phosphoacceptor domain -containing protein [Anaerolineae bacterium]|jgi:two-component sensor histidine kinase